MKYKVKSDFLYIADDTEPSLAYIFKQGEIYGFSPFTGKNSESGDMICDHTIYESEGESGLCMLVIEKDMFNEYFEPLETDNEYIN